MSSGGSQAGQALANHGLHPTRLSPLEIGGYTRFVVGLVAEAHSRTRRAGEANRSDRPLRARSEWRGGLRPPVRPGSLRSRRPNLRVQPTLRLVHFVPRLARLTRRAIMRPLLKC
jgi:hypothetical protein